MGVSMNKVRHSCQTCHGSGRVRVLHEANSEGGYWSVVHCQDCQGHGFIVIAVDPDDSDLTE